MLIDYGIIGAVGLLIYSVADRITDSIINNSDSQNGNMLTVGYEKGLFRKPIIVDMNVTPHLLCCGLSGQGKSKCIEYAVRGKDVVLLNAFEDDFKSIKARRIIGNENILHYLETLVREPYKRNKPLYIVIDELLVCCMDKKISNAIKDLLAIGRHYNVFVIGIAQRGTKTDLSFKDLFNARMTFRQVEESSYRAILGVSVEERNLKKREFIIMSDDVYYGKSYDIN